MLVDEQDIVLEAGIQMRLKTQMHNHRVVMAVDVRVDAIQALEYLADSGRKVFGERDADAGRESGFVVDVGLYPRHEVFDIFWSWHLGGFGVACCGVLPKVLEPIKREQD
jgi:hypothetical protein